MTGKPITRGNLYGAVLVMAEGWKRLKTPHVDLYVPTLGTSVSINVSGEYSAEPGTLAVYQAGVGFEHEGGRRFFGRISPSGHWQPAHDCPPQVGERLYQFAGNPARVAGQSGHHSGKCPFCRQPLNEVGSQEAGYDELCAMSYGLPWTAESTFGPGMSGLQMKAIREAMEMDYTTFGETVLGNVGSQRNIDRAVRRLEEKAVLHVETAEKVTAYYRQWVEDRADLEHEAGEAYRSLRQVVQ